MNAASRIGGRTDGGERERKISHDGERSCGMSGVRRVWIVWKGGRVRKGKRVETQMEMRRSRTGVWACARAGVEECLVKKCNLPPHARAAASHSSS